MQKKNIEYLSSAFDIPSLEFLYKLKINQFKIPSGEIVNYQYLKKLASFRKKIVCSTECLQLLKLLMQLKFFKIDKKEEIIILHCNSEYQLHSDVNLKAMLHLRKKFKIPQVFRIIH